MTRSAAPDGPQVLDLDDPGALGRADAAALLPAVASGAAQVREAALLSAEAGVRGLADEGRPRAVVVCAAGASAVAGDVLAGLAGVRCPVPVLVHRGAGLPTWVGATDLVVAVSCSGRTEQTLSALAEAVRRGCRLLVVAAPASPLAELGARGRAVLVPVRPGRPARASLWALAVPLVVAAGALGLLTARPDEVEEAAQTLEQTATSCAPYADTVVNPAKLLALEIEGTLPVVWGTSVPMGVAAYRCASALHEAGVPALWGELPEAAHSQVGLLDGRWAGQEPADLFRDRVDEPERPGLRLVLLRDVDEPPPVARAAQACVDLADSRRVGVSLLQAQGGSPLARLASLVGITDFAAVYAGLLQGKDPSRTPAVEVLQQRMAG